MCRLLFINKNISTILLKKFLKQSVTKKNTPFLNNIRDLDLHLDGFGFIWVNSDNNVLLYKNHTRPSNDYNIGTILDLINGSYLIGHLRATEKFLYYPVNFHSTHPFNYLDFYFCHNGCVEKFSKNKKTIMLTIKKQYYNNIKSNCDSEYLFYLFISLFDTVNMTNDIDEKKIKKTIKMFFEFLNNLSGTVSANIILKYKEFTIISRYINSNEEPPSLYHNKGYTIVSSEPIDNNELLVKKNTIIIFKNNSVIDLFNISL
jgi:glutamine amidotransferase